MLRNNKNCNPWKFSKIAIINERNSFRIYSIYHTCISLCHYFIFTFISFIACKYMYRNLPDIIRIPLSHYIMIKFVSNLCQVEGFPRYSGFLHQQNWMPGYNLNIVESGIKHHKHKPNLVSTPFPVIYTFCQWGFEVMSYWQDKKIYLSYWEYHTILISRLPDICIFQRSNHSYHKRAGERYVFANCLPIMRKVRLSTPYGCKRLKKKLKKEG